MSGLRGQEQADAYIEAIVKKELQMASFNVNQPKLNRLLRLFSMINSTWGMSEALRWYSLQSTDQAEVVDCGRKLMSCVPPAFGYCMMMSAALAAMLRDKHGIPALPIAGNLFVNDSAVFRMNSPLPIAEGDGEVQFDWDGHCWVDIGGKIADVSIFRSAYSAPMDTLLSSYIRSAFGAGKGLIYCSYDEADELGLKYDPIAVMGEDCKRAANPY